MEVFFTGGCKGRTWCAAAAVCVHVAMGRTQRLVGEAPTAIGQTYAGPRTRLFNLMNCLLER